MIQRGVGAAGTQAQAAPPVPVSRRS
jgi:hypothetical protein